MDDKGVCSYCNGEFIVTPDMYGYRTPCPLCGKKIDIFPDNKYYIDTPWGVIGIGYPDGNTNFIMRPILSWLIKKAVQGKEKLKEIGK